MYYFHSLYFFNIFNLFIINTRKHYLIIIYFFNIFISFFNNEY